MCAAVETTDIPLNVEGVCETGTVDEMCICNNKVYGNVCSYRAVSVFYSKTCVCLYVCRRHRSYCVSTKS